MRALLSILCLFSLYGLVTLSDYVHVIHVDPNNPNSTNNSTCYDSEQVPCADINFALAFPDRHTSTIFHLSSNATHKLANNATTTIFTGSSQIAFVGDNGTATIECMEGAGLAFINSTKIALRDVSFLFCGAWRHSTSKDFSSNAYYKLMSIRVGLYFYNCSNVSMSLMNVLNSTEAVGVVMYSVAGENYISNSHFDNNRINESNKNESGGGGFAVEFNYCKPGDDTCGENNTQTKNIRNASYIFENCSFINNRAIDQSGQNKSGVSILPNNKTHSSLGRGGGLSLYFKGEASANSFAIKNCTFQDNQANWGGGLCVQYADHSIQNRITVTNTNFEANHCFFDHHQSGETGGGALVSSPVHYDVKRDSLKRNEIFFTDCCFTDNHAVTGGALAFVYTRQRQSHYFQIFQANLLNSIFKSNSARLGSAVSVDHEYFYHQGQLGDISISDCIFKENKIVYTNPEKAYSIGIGAVYISEVPATFQGSIKFLNNDGSALALVGTRISFAHNSTINFTANNGSNGGAIALLGVSSMLIGVNAHMHFERNVASRFGGAIYNSYTGKEDLRSSVKCFIQYDYPFSDPKSWNAQFVFKNNSAGKLGDSIYSTTILPCSWTEDFQVEPELAHSIFCWNESIWRYEGSNCTSQIYTAPQKFTNVTTINGTKVYPGHPFQLDINAADDLDHDVTIETIYTALVVETDTAAIDPQYAYVANGSLGVTGQGGQNVTLQLDVASNRDWRIDVALVIEKCPIGYKAQNASSSNEADTLKETTCECIGGQELNTFRGNLICNKADMTSTIQNAFWIGYVENIAGIPNDTLYMGRFILKNISESISTIRDSDFSDTQCSVSNRTGTLCGECLEGYSVAVNSYTYNCIPCIHGNNDTNLAKNAVIYIALTYVPYLILFLLIIFFNINLMSGYLSGFILYAQLIGSGVIELTVDRLPSQKYAAYLQKWYRMSYGIFNLNSFSGILSPFCISEDSGTLGVISLDYGVAIFPLVLIIVIWLAVSLVGRCNLGRTRNRALKTLENSQSSTSRKIGDSVKKFFSRNFIHAFVGFIYLSYTKMTLAATLTLTTVGVFDQNGTYVTSPRLIYYAGQYYFGQWEYILPYGLIAIIVYIFAIVLPLVLSGGLDLVNWLTGLEKCVLMRKLWPSLTINSFLDAMRDCYRPDRLYFAGIYFLFRLVMLMIFAFSSNLLTLVLCQLLIIILMVILVTVMLPYKQMLHNFIDILLLLNMAAIMLISIYLFSAPSNNGSTYPIELYIFGAILIWLPMVYLLIYLCSLCLRKTQAYKNTTEKFQNHPAVLFLYKHFSNLELYREIRQRSMVGATVLTESMILLNRAEEHNTYQPANPKVTKSTVFGVHDTSGTADVKCRYGINDT